MGWLVRAERRRLHPASLSFRSVPLGLRGRRSVWQGRLSAALTPPGKLEPLTKQRVSAGRAT